MNMLSRWRIAALASSLLLVLASCGGGGGGDGEPDPDGVPVAVTVQGPGRVTSDQGGLDCADTCTLHVPAGETVELTAVPDGNNAFVAWDGACDTFANPCELTVSGGESVGASFDAHALRLELIGDGEGAFRIQPPDATCEESCGVGFDTSLLVAITHTGGDDANVLEAWDGPCDEGSRQEDYCLVEVEGEVSVAKTWRHPPVGDADAYATDEDTALQVSAERGVLSNDDDTEGDTLTAERKDGVSNGTLEFDTDGSFTYTPASDFDGVDGFTYVARDEFGNESDETTATITVRSTNDPPDANDDSYDATEDEALVVDPPGVLGNDSDPDGDSLQAELEEGPSNGDLALDDDGSFEYTPNQNFNGTDSFTYRASDPFDATSGVATVTIEVAAVNDPPVATDDSYDGTEDEVLNVDAPGVLENDSDAEGDDLTAHLDSDVDNGELSLSADGSFTYDPDTNFNGTDTFTYHAEDDSGAASEPATVTITVEAVNDAPVANSDAFEVNEGATLDVDAPGVLEDDTDPDGDTLTVSDYTQPSNGSVTVSENGALTYTPDANFNGTDTFTYTATDGQASDDAQVTITVNPVNDPPNADDDSYDVDEDELLSVPAPGVLDGDTDPEGDALTAHLDNDVDNGNLSLSADGSFTYDPNTDFNGTDTFTYHAEDTSGAASDPATVTITVNPVNDPPTANDDENYDVDEDGQLNVSDPGVLGNDTDPDGDTLTVSDYTQPSNGSVTVDDNGSLTYTPNSGYAGTDSFTYTATDGQASDNAQVTITVNEVNEGPTAVADTYETDEGATLNEPAPGVLANDTDPDDDALTASVTESVTNGNLTLDQDGSFTYTPNTGYAGTDSFTYEATDGQASDTATATITINEVNEGPTAVADTYETDEDVTLNEPAPGVLANDTDPDDDALTASVTESVTNGNLTLDQDGSFTYTPNTGYAGTDSFTYEATDGQASDTATATITINEVNEGPTAEGDRAM